MRRFAFASLVAVLACAGCSDPTVDARGSEEETRDSILAVKDSLPPERQDDFETAMKALVFADLDLGALADPEGYQRKIMDRIHGKTADEIISEAQTLRAERKEKERREAISEIEELAAKLDPAAEALCAKLTVWRTRYSRRGQGFLSGPGIELTVRNDTPHAISRVYFTGLVLTPGRSIPWVDAEFSYGVSGGLEPGELAEWSLSPSTFGGWAQVPADRHDTVFIARAIGFEGPDEQSLTGERFTSDDRKRLLSLLDAVEYEGAEQIRASLASRDEMVERWIEAASRRTALAELAELHQAQASADEARSSLASFEVTRSRFYRKKGDFSRDPVIDITVHNGTDEVVTRFYAQGVLSSPGREAPWVDDSFNYSARGGLEPGEVQQYKLVPNMFGEWASAPRDRDDMVLTITITRLDGADGEQLFAAEWDDERATRHAALAKVTAEQGWE